MTIAMPTRLACCRRRVSLRRASAPPREERAKRPRNCIPPLPAGAKSLQFTLASSEWGSASVPCWCAQWRWCRWRSSGSSARLRGGGAGGRSGIGPVTSSVSVLRTAFTAVRSSASVQVNRVDGPGRMAADWAELGAVGVRVGVRPLARAARGQGRVRVLRRQ